MSKTLCSRLVGMKSENRIGIDVLPLLDKKSVQENQKSFPLIDIKSGTKKIDDSPRENKTGKHCGGPD